MIEVSRAPPLVVSVVVQVRVQLWMSFLNLVEDDVDL
jgi:hypothetical protein